MNYVLFRNNMQEHEFAPFLVSHIWHSAFTYCVLYMVWYIIIGTTTKDGLKKKKKGYEQNIRVYYVNLFFPVKS